VVGVVVGVAVAVVVVVAVAVGVVVVVVVGVGVGVVVVVGVGVAVAVVVGVTQPKEITMRTISVSDETWVRIKAQVEEEGGVEVTSLDSLVGQSWFFRTVSYHLVGKVEKRLGNFLLLRNASWVADSGRFMQAIKDGTLNEVEPVGDALVNLDAVTDAFPWKHALPDKQK